MNKLLYISIKSLTKVIGLTIITLSAMAVHAESQTQKETNIDTSLPGSFPRSSVFNGYYKHIKDTDIYFPTGDWRLIANGRIYNFEVSVNDRNDISVVSWMGNIKVVKWDKSSGYLEFTREREIGKGRILKQRFTGNLMSYADGKQPGSQRDYKWRMAGTFVHESSKLNSDEPHSWYATISR